MAVFHGARKVVGATALLTLAACSDGFDLDLRGALGDNFSTSQAARGTADARPTADARGVISYPTYQVAVARRGDTLADVAARVGLPAEELGRFNGIRVEDGLREGEIIALPRRVSEPEGIGAPAEVDVSELASNAIDSAEPTPVAQTTLPDPEPVRHQVERGETAFTIARLYNVPVRALADWNALDAQYTLREGQFLLIPTGVSQTEPVDAQETTNPGQGSPTPVPPSASQPVPQGTEPPPIASDEPEPASPAPTLEQTEAPASSGSRMSVPVIGSIIRDYDGDSTDGITYSASVGTAVTAAAAGEVVYVGSDSSNVPLLIVRHPDNLLTVYRNVNDVAVQKGATVRKGGKLGQVGQGNPPYVEFQVRQGADSVDPTPFLG